MPPGNYKVYFRYRFIFVVVVTVIVATVLILRLYFLQIVHADYYKSLAERQYQNGGAPLFDRGNIYFSTKDGFKVPAAVVARGYKIAIHPNQITDPQKILKALNNIITLEETEFLQKAAKKEDPYEEIARRVTEDKARKIRSLKLEGVSVYEDRWRLYPNQTLAAHVLGFVGYKGDDFGGRYGVERYYNKELARGRRANRMNFFIEILRDAKDFISGGQRENADILLTIDFHVQRQLEEVLSRVLEEEEARTAAGIILDPVTGEIIGMASLPSYDPNRYYEVEDIGVFSNPLVQNVYEVGSIMKPLTLAAALDAGVLDEEDTYVDEGSVRVGDVTISNYDYQARGEVAIQEILNQSLNTGAVYVMSLLGPELFKKYMEGFGLTNKTLIDLPDEGRSITDSLKRQNIVELATASFGQGIAVTPIAMVRALAALANGGYVIRPHVAKSFMYPGFADYTVKVEEQGTVISQNTSLRISDMLVRVVDEALLGGRVKLDHYTVAAKTGTAQVPSPEGGYYQDKFLHTFFGYAPVPNPRFLVFLMIEEPKGRYASQTLTKPFMEILNFLFAYYEVPPNR